MRIAKNRGDTGRYSSAELYIFNEWNSYLEIVTYDDLAYDSSGNDM